MDVNRAVVIRGGVNIQKVIEFSQLSVKIVRPENSPRATGGVEAVVRTENGGRNGNRALAPSHC